MVFFNLNSHILIAFIRFFSHTKAIKYSLIMITILIFKLTLFLPFYKNALSYYNSYTLQFLSKLRDTFFCFALEQKNRFIFTILIIYVWCERILEQEQNWKYNCAKLQIISNIFSYFGFINQLKFLNNWLLYSIERPSFADIQNQILIFQRLI